jgi:hypothetical protein
MHGGTCLGMRTDVWNIHQHCICITLAPSRSAYKPLYSNLNVHNFCSHLVRSTLFFVQQWIHILWLITDVCICISFKTAVSNSCYAEVNEWITVKGKEMKEVGTISINVLWIWLEGQQRTVTSEQSLFWPRSNLSISWVKVRGITS